MRTLIAGLIGALVLAGCNAPAPEPSPVPEVDPDLRSTIVVDGVERTYLLTPPPGDGAALVLMLHGGQDDAADARRDYNWPAVAAAEGFAVAYPDGIGGTWNAVDCCGPAQAQNVDDVGFVLALVDELIAVHRIDPARVYATGFSNGALLAYRLACETDRFAAVAAVGGTMLGECESPAPLSVLHIHGDADAAVPLDGLIPEGATGIQGSSITDANEFWRSIDECGEPAVIEDGAVTTSLAQCADDRQVQLTLVEGAGHQWPGSLVLRSGVDATSDAFDATALIWSFLSPNRLA